LNQSRPPIRITLELCLPELFGSRFFFVSLIN
jgi:hypothetical protein